MQAAALALDDDGRVESAEMRGAPTGLRLLEGHGIAATLAHRRERERFDVNTWTVSGLSARQSFACAGHPQLYKIG
jgi:hypothetical protein